MESEQRSLSSPQFLLLPFPSEDPDTDGLGWGPRGRVLNAFHSELELSVSNFLLLLKMFVLQ